MIRATRFEPKYRIRRGVLYAIAFALLYAFMAAVTEPTPACTTPYGESDTTECVQNGHLWWHGIQRG